METKNNQSASALVRQIKRKTRRVFTAEEKIAIVMEGMRGEDSVASLCRKSMASTRTTTITGAKTSWKLRR